MGFRPISVEVYCFTDFQVSMKSLGNNQPENCALYHYQALQCLPFANPTKYLKGLVNPQ